MVASLGSNRVLVVYELAYDGIYAQVFDEDGNKIGTEFQVHTSTLNRQTQPSCSSLGSTQAIVVWSSNHNGRSGLYAQIIDSNSSRVGSEFRVDEGTSDPRSGNVSPIGSNRAIITWSALVTGTSDLSPTRAIYAQIINHEGEKMGSVFQVSSNSHRTVNVNDVQQVSSLGFNRAIIVFTGMDRDGKNRIYARVVDSEGNKPGTEFLVSDNLYAASERMMGDQRPAVFTFKDSTSFVVAWMADSNGVMDKHYMRMYTIRSGGFDACCTACPCPCMPASTRRTQVLRRASAVLSVRDGTALLNPRQPTAPYAPLDSTAPEGKTTRWPVQEARLLRLKAQRQSQRAPCVKRAQVPLLVLQYAPCVSPER